MANTIYTKEIGIRLKIARQDMDLTKKDVCEAFGLTNVRYYSQLESGFANITLQHIERCVTCYNLNPNWLIIGQGSMFLNGTDTRATQAADLMDRLQPTEKAGDRLSKLEERIEALESATDFAISNLEKRLTQAIQQHGKALEQVQQELGYNPATTESVREQIEELRQLLKLTQGKVDSMDAAASRHLQRIDKKIAEVSHQSDINIEQVAALLKEKPRKPHWWEVLPSLWK